MYSICWNLHYFNRLKIILFQKKWLFTVRINCFIDLKKKSIISEPFFLAVGQNNFRNKIPSISISANIRIRFCMIKLDLLTNISWNCAVSLWQFELHNVCIKEYFFKELKKKELKEETNYELSSRLLYPWLWWWCIWMECNLCPFEKCIIRLFQLLNLLGWLK